MVVHFLGNLWENRTVFKKYKISFVISIIIVLAVYSYLFYQLFYKTDVREIFDTISHLRFVYLLIGIGLSALMTVTQGLLILEIFKLYKIKMSLKESIATWLIIVPTGAVTVGLGGVAVLFYKARRKGCSSQFAAVVTISYVVLSFSAVLIYSLLFGGSAFIQTAIKNDYSIFISCFAVILAVLFCLMLFNRKVREYLFHFVRKFFPKFLPQEETEKIDELKNYQIIDIFLYIFFIYLANFIIFTFCLYIFHADLGFISVLKNFSIIQAISTISPSGSGMGFVELGMLGSLKYSGISIHEAGAITITYRLFNFWLPAICGWTILSLKGVDYLNRIKNDN